MSCILENIPGGGKTTFAKDCSLASFDDCVKAYTRFSGADFVSRYDIMPTTDFYMPHNSPLIWYEHENLNRRKHLFASKRSVRSMSELMRSINMEDSGKMTESITVMLSKLGYTKVQDEKVLSLIRLCKYCGSMDGSFSEALSLYPSLNISSKNFNREGKKLRIVCTKGPYLTMFEIGESTKLGKYIYIVWSFELWNHLPMYLKFDGVPFIAIEAYVKPCSGFLQMRDTMAGVQESSDNQIYTKFEELTAELGIVDIPDNDPSEITQFIKGIIDGENEEFNELDTTDKKSLGKFRRLLKAFEKEAELEVFGLKSELLEFRQTTMYAREGLVLRTYHISPFDIYFNVSRCYVDSLTSLMFVPPRVALPGGVSGDLLNSLAANSRTESIYMYAPVTGSSGSSFEAYDLSALTDGKVIADNSDLRQASNLFVTSRATNRVVVHFVAQRDLGKKVFTCRLSDDRLCSFHEDDGSVGIVKKPAVSIHVDYLVDFSSLKHEIFSSSLKAIESSDDSDPNLATDGDSHKIRIF